MAALTTENGAEIVSRRRGIAVFESLGLRMFLLLLFLLLCLPRTGIGSCPNSCLAGWTSQQQQCLVLLLAGATQNRGF